jgi:hypothetical protein
MRIIGEPSLVEFCDISLVSRFIDILNVNEVIEQEYHQEIYRRDKKQEREDTIVEIDGEPTDWNFLYSHVKGFERDG